MQSVIEQIFIKTLEELDGRPIKNKNDEEYETYEKLCSTLDEKQSSIFDKFLELYGERKCKHTEELYRLGFKTGFMIAIEAMLQINI